MHILSKDLNLLVVAAALFRHKNVSKAAGELGLSQSAVSHALARLRDQFKDPLFVRTSRGVAPTEFARSIQDEVLKLVRETELLFSQKKTFDPKQVNARITLATTDYFETAVMSRLQSILAIEAPELQLSIRPTVGELPKRELEDGKIDLAIAGFYSDLPEGFYQAKLMTDTFACAVRSGHPIFKGDPVDLDDYFDASHALITLQGDFREQLVHKVGKLKRSRKITYGSYSFTGVAWVLSRSDLILTAPKKLLLEYKSFFPIRILNCPVDFGKIELQMVWHAQTQSNPLHAWLRKKIRTICNEKVAL